MDLFENLQNLHIAEGIKTNDSEFVFDYTKDDNKDLINLVDYKLYKSNINNNVYYFGYKFTDASSREERTKFINFIKGYGDTQIKPNELQRFIDRPLSELNKTVGLNNIDVIVYPESQKNNLNQKIIKSVINFMPRNKEYGTYAMIKKLPQEITFDYKSFEADKGGKDSQTYKDSLPNVEIIIKKIKSLDYFHIAKDVKPKYRAYIQNYLKPKTEFSENILNAKTILAIDDINTSGSTLRELLRMLTEVNSKVNILIYTLIGKE